MSDPAFEDFVNLELPRRTVMFTEGILAVTGDPNTGIDPTLDAAPGGTFWLDALTGQRWFKTSSSPTSWVPSLDATGAETRLFVDDVAGLDTNDGLTAGTALKTIAAAIVKLPFFIRHRVEIIIKPHGGTGYPMPLLGVKALEETVWFIGDGFTELLAPSAAGAGTDNSKVVYTTGGLTVDMYRGKTVEFTSGAASGYRQTVHSNTATDLLFSQDTDPGGGAVPSPGDTFHVVEPEVRIDLTAGPITAPTYTVAAGAGDLFHLSAGTGGVGYANLGLDAVADVSVEPLWRDITVHMYGIELGQVNSRRVDLRLENAHLHIGSTNNAQTRAYASVNISSPFGAVDNEAWVGWGLYRYDTTGNASFSSELLLSSTVRAYLVAAEDRKIEVYNVYLKIGGGNVDAWRISGTNGYFEMWTFATNAIKCHSKTANPCISLTGKTLVNVIGVDFDATTAEVWRIDSTAAFWDWASTGQSAGAVSVSVGDNSVLETYGALLIGDAVADDIEVRGAAAVNKSFFAAANDTLSAAGSYITRGFI